MNECKDHKKHGQGCWSYPNCNCFMTSEPKTDYSQKAIDVIAGLCNEDLGWPGTVSQLQEKIWRFVHLAQGTCQAEHEDWKAEIDTYYNELKALDVI